MKNYVSILFLFLFTYSYSQTQLGSDISGENSGDWFGKTVSISDDGSTLAVGAGFNDGNGSNSGHVRVYKWDGSSWNQIGNDIDGEASNDYFGWSISLSEDGTTVGIGTPYNDGNGGGSGHVRIYNWDGSSWNQIGNDIDGENNGDRSGNSISISDDGNTIAIGAENNDGGGNNAGHVRIFNWDGSSWNQIGDDIDGNNDSEKLSNVSLSSDGTRVAIGSAYSDEGRLSVKGFIRMWRLWKYVWRNHLFCSIYLPLSLFKKTD